ncbi:MAG TPA: DUF4160 domain-containing protein [Candidatus Binatia bacterium]|nr:DUF4160 domain-containing protein [Candidatus Binatia bacterium]
MPEISRFLGIVVAMFCSDHAPPHFTRGTAITRSPCGSTMGAVDGDFPRRALGLLLEWYALHREELRDNWERARARSPLQKIEPLE